MLELTVTFKTDPSHPERVENIASDYTRKLKRPLHSKGETELIFTFETEGNIEGFKREINRLLPNTVQFGGIIDSIN